MKIRNTFTPVILAGAGPGDPDLISVKALNWIRKADVILTDRLVSPELISENARKEALVIYVGKQCARGIHTSQEKINELMVEFARQNKKVLRLKGGDACLFSNILDELSVLKSNGIPYEIIPGISAAFGASAYTGIPLTARSYSRGVRFLTLFDLSNVTPEEWKDWATTEDTLVFYMSGRKSQELANRLVQNGIGGKKGMAVVEQATTPEQFTRIFKFNGQTPELPVFDHVPTLLIIGNVVNLNASFAWFEEKEARSSYFDNHLIPLSHAI